MNKYSKCKRVFALLLALTLCITGCESKKNSTPVSDTANESTAQPDVSVEDALSSMITIEYKEEDLDAEWSSDSAVLIVCSDKEISVEGTGADVKDGNITITSGGTYVISGTLSDGQITVNAGKEDMVHLVLNNASLNCKDGAVIYGEQSDKIILTLEEGSTNQISDGKSYGYGENSEDEPNAAIFSKDDVTINGTGSLSVNGNYNHGIYSKDSLMIVSGILDITAVNDGLKGKDDVTVKEAAVSINAGGDGIQSNNDSDTAKGYVVLEGGTFTINSGNDGIQAETLLQITGGEYQIISGGGNEQSDTDSKGIKSGTVLCVTGGKFSIDSADDSVHTNGTAALSGGNFTITSGDDGIHADSELIVGGAEINITKSYEGLEGKSISILDGTIHVKSSDDGVNAAGGNDGSSVTDRTGKNTFQASGDSFINIEGGYLYVDAAGDGIDSNGALYVSGGTTLVNGPEDSGNGAMDYDTIAEITGGVFAAAGGSGMAQTFSDTSAQNSVMIYYSSIQTAETAANILDSTGNTIFSFVPSKNYQSIVISTPKMKTGETYSLTAGGTVEGIKADGYNKDADNTTGTKLTDITLNSTAVKISDDGSEVTGGMGNGMGGGKPGENGFGGERPEGGEKGGGMRGSRPEDDGTAPTMPDDMVKPEDSV